MTKLLELGPLLAECGEGRITFRFAHPDEPALELPPDYDLFLHQQLAGVFGGSGATLDLANLPGLSSRQLGVMLALQKALREQGPRLPVLNAQPAVRRLLEMSRTERFFEFGAA